MSVAFGAKVPRLFTEKLGHTTKNHALDHHLTVQVIIHVKAAHALNGDSVQDDAATLVIDFPPLNNALDISSGWGRCDIKVHISEFVGPQPTKVVNGVRNRDKEGVCPATETRKVRARHWTAHSPTVTVTVETAIGRGARKGVCLLIPGHVLNARATDRELRETRAPRLARRKII